MGKELNDTLIIHNAVNILKKAEFKPYKTTDYEYIQYNDIFIIRNTILNMYSIVEAPNVEEAWKLFSTRYFK